MFHGRLPWKFALSCFVLAIAEETCEHIQLPMSMESVGSSALLQIRAADVKEAPKSDGKQEEEAPKSDEKQEDFATGNCTSRLLQPASALFWTLCGMICIMGVSCILVIGLPASTCAPEGERYSRVRVHFLDGLKVLMIAYVIIFHNCSGGDDPAAWTQSTLAAHASMQVFFVLSGFMAGMTMNGVASFQLRSGTIYILSRLLRLVPAYYASMLAVFGLNCRSEIFAVPVDESKPWVAWPLASVFGNTLVQWPCGQIGNSDWNYIPFVACAPGWFVSDLVIATLFLPIAHNLTCGCGPIALGSLLILVILIRSAAAIAEMLGNPLPEDLVDTFGNYVSPIPRTLEVLAGFLSMQVSRSMQSVKLNGWPWVFDGACVAAVALAMAVSQMESILHVSFFGDYLITSVVGVMCIAAYGAASVDGGKSKGMEGSGIAYRILEWFSTTRITAWLSNYSYQALMFSQIIAKFLYRALDLFGAQMPESLWIVSVLAASWGIGAIFAQRLEEPLQRTIKPYLH